MSNRLPYVLDKQTGGGWALKPGSGGLVTALLPVLRDRGGIWIGWPGVTDEVPDIAAVLRQASRGTGYSFEPVLLSQGRGGQVLSRVLEREHMAAVS